MSNGPAETAAGPGPPPVTRRSDAGSEKTGLDRLADRGLIEARGARRAALPIRVRWMVSSLLGPIRVRLFMPDPSETQMAGKPGWHAAGVDQLNQLERVGNTFMDGLRVGLDGTPVQAIMGRLESIDKQYRGFA